MKLVASNIKILASDWIGTDFSPYEPRKEEDFSPRQQSAWTQPGSSYTRQLWHRGMHLKSVFYLGERKLGKS